MTGCEHQQGLEAKPKHQQSRKCQAATPSKHFNGDGGPKSPRSRTFEKAEHCASSAPQHHTHTHTPTSPRIEAALGGGDLSDSVCEGVACEGEPVPETWGAHRCPIHQRTDPPTPSGSPELASDSSSAPCSSLERRYLIDRGHPQFPLPCDHVVARV